MLARYADVRAALADAATFSSAAGVGVSDEMNAMQAGSVLASDDPEHPRLRAVLSEKLFSQIPISEYEGSNDSCYGRQGND